MNIGNETVFAQDDMVQKSYRCRNRSGKDAFFRYSMIEKRGFRGLRKFRRFRKCSGLVISDWVDDSLSRVANAEHQVQPDYKSG